VFRRPLHRTERLRAALIQLVMTRAEDLDGALCPAPDPSHLGGSGRLHDESGVKEKAPPSPGGGGADDICCLCSFLDVPPDKATRGARDGSPSGLTSRQGARVIEDSRRLRAVYRAPGSSQCGRKGLLAQFGNAGIIPCRSRVTRGIVCQRNPARSLDKSSSPKPERDGFSQPRTCLSTPAAISRSAACG